LWLTLDDSPNAPVNAEWPERLRAASQVQWATTSITMQIFELIAGAQFSLSARADVG
jgi:hypothetical protein